MESWQAHRRRMARYAARPSVRCAGCKRLVARGRLRVRHPSGVVTHPACVEPTVLTRHDKTVAECIAVLEGCETALAALAPIEKTLPGGEPLLLLWASVRHLARAARALARSRAS